MCVVTFLDPEQGNSLDPTTIPISVEQTIIGTRNKKLPLQIVLSINVDLTGISPNTLVPSYISLLIEHMTYGWRDLNKSWFDHNDPYHVLYESAGNRDIELSQEDTSSHKCVDVFHRQLEPRKYKLKGAYVPVINRIWPRIPGENEKIDPFCFAIFDIEISPEKPLQQGKNNLLKLTYFEKNGRQQTGPTSRWPIYGPSNVIKRTGANFTHLNNLTMTMWKHVWESITIMLKRESSI